MGWALANLAVESGTLPDSVHTDVIWGTPLVGRIMVSMMSHMRVRLGLGPVCQLVK